MSPTDLLADVDLFADLTPQELRQLADTSTVQDLRRGDVIFHEDDPADKVYLVIEGRGPALRWFGVLVASIVFAVLHPFLWRWDEAGFAPTLTGKGAFSTGIVFATSLWLYVARFAAWLRAQHVARLCYRERLGGAGPDHLLRLATGAAGHAHPVRSWQPEMSDVL